MNLRDQNFLPTETGPDFVTADGQAACRTTEIGPLDVKSWISIRDDEGVTRRVTASNVHANEARAHGFESLGRAYVGLSLIRREKDGTTATIETMVDPETAREFAEALLAAADEAEAERDEAAENAA